MASGGKKRNYSNEYIKFGFTQIHVGGFERPQCVICFKTLSADSMKPSLLKRHLNGCHPELKDKDVLYFQRKENGVKQVRLDTTGTYKQQTISAIETSYVISLKIAQQKKPHTIGESLILPCIKETVRLMLGEDNASKLAPLSLSNITVNRRIIDMSEDVKLQIVAEMKAAPLGIFSIQLDESTDVSSCAQLICFVRYIYEGDFKEDFLFCLPLSTTTKGNDIFEKVNAFFIDNGLDWKNLCAICSDGAPAMLGCRSGFQARVKAQVGDVMSLHCMIHRHALASKTLPPLLSDVMSGVIKLVNYIKRSVLNTRLFRELCKEFDASSENLLFHTEVRWLSRGNVFKRVFELRAEIQEFVHQQKNPHMLSQFNIEERSLELAYLVDIFFRLNLLNLSMQGKQSTVLDFVDKVNAFLMKLDLWTSQIRKGIYNQF